MNDLENNSPLPGVTREEYTKLLLSVGHTSKSRRPYSPVEVGEILMKSKCSGMSANEMTPHLNMTDTSMPGKFLKLVDLDEAIQYLVAWGASEKKALGFSVAAQLSRLEPTVHQEFVENCLKNAITKDEAASVIQLYERSGQSLDECFKRVVGRRPTTRTLEVIIGSITSKVLSDVLTLMSQSERDQLFGQAINRAYPEADKFSPKLGKNRFTIIGGKSIGSIISADKDFSQKLNECLGVLVNKVHNQ